MTDAKSIKIEPNGCGKRFERDNEEYYCGDLDYSDNPVIHYCDDCKKLSVEHIKNKTQENGK